MPAWMQRMLIDKGVLGHNGLSDRARIHTCRQCRLPVLAGWDARSGALDAWCDLAELTLEGELQALLDNRQTYHLDADRIQRRNRYAIQAIPAGGQLPINERPRYPFEQYPVFAQHRCNEPIPTAWTVQPLTELAAPTTEGEPCPF